MNRNFSAPVVVLLLSSIGWGLTWLPIRYFQEQGIGSPLLVFIAFSSGLFLLLPALIRQRQLWFPCLRYMLLIALFGGLANLCFQVSMGLGDAVRAMILFYLLPVWSVIGGRIVLGEHIDKVRTLAVVLCLLGAFFILGGFNIDMSHISLIDVIAVLAGMTFAANNITFRVVPQIPLASKVAAMFIGCSVLSGIYVSTQEFPEISTNTEQYAYAVFYGITWILLINFGTQWAVTKLEAGRASVIMVIELVTVVVSSAVVMLVWPGWIELIGAVFVISAAIIEGLRADNPEEKRRVALPVRELL